MAAYTDADVQAATHVFLKAHRDNDFEQDMRAVLDAVAPAIAARAKAEALREAAIDILDTRGERKWLLNRADEIERT